MSFEVGTMVGIPASYAKGPFSNEMLVTFDTGDEIISGFVDRENVQFIDDVKALVRAKIVRVGEDSYDLKFYGHFFTTNGIEPVSLAWAAEHLKVAA